MSSRGLGQDSIFTRDSQSAMANTSISYLQGDCMAPFLDAARFPDQGGFVGGRFCAPIPGLPNNPTCCIPCPATEWAYSDSFTTYTTVAEWLNVVGLILMIFMLLSYLVLPAQKTRSHYLSVCLIISVMMITIGFTVPLSAQPDQCFNEITPNDMFTSNECAWSGAFIIAGGLCATMWVFIRALSMNLQICWDIVPGRKFFYGAQAVGWGIPAALFTATLTVTGVSFRFGNACHVNHDDSMRDFWGPLLAFAGLAGLLQLATCTYCIHVYLKNLFSDQTQTSTTTSELPSYTSSVRTQTARAVYARLKKVLWLQWRGISIVSIILVDVVFFSVVFVYLDNLQEAAVNDWRKVEPWLVCLAMNPTDKNQCLGLVHGWVVNESTVAAVLMLLSLSGVQVFLFLTRPSVFPAWIEYFRSQTGEQHEFVSLDARPDVMRSNSKQELIRYERGHEKTTFEMQKPAHNLHLDLDSKTMSPTQTILSSPDDTYRSPLQHGRTTPLLDLDPRNSIASSVGQYRSVAPLDYVNRTTSPTTDLGSPPTPVVRYDAISLHRQDPDYFMQRATSSGSARSGERRYQAPNASFSAPKTPSRQSSLRSETRDLNSHGLGVGSSHAGGLWPPFGRSGLALNPPSEKGESQEDLSVYSSHSMDEERR